VDKDEMGVVEAEVDKNTRKVDKNTRGAGGGGEQ
jgi:hypothetical protein